MKRVLCSSVWVTVTFAVMDARSNSEYCEKHCCIGELLHYHVAAVLQNYCIITWLLYWGATTLSCGCCIGEILHYHVAAVLQNYCIITWLQYYRTTALSRGCSITELLHYNVVPDINMHKIHYCCLQPQSLSPQYKHASNETKKYVSGLIFRYFNHKFRKTYSVSDTRPLEERCSCGIQTRFVIYIGNQFELHLRHKLISLFDIYIIIYILLKGLHYCSCDMKGGGGRTGFIWLRIATRNPLNTVMNLRVP